MAADTLDVRMAKLEESPEPTIGHHRRHLSYLRLFLRHGRHADAALGLPRRTRVR